MATITTNKTMKALYSVPVPVPTLPTSQLGSNGTGTIKVSKILVKVLASGVNPSDGLNGLTLAFPFRARKAIIPGRDFAGIVRESQSSSFSVGDAVFGSSGNVYSFSEDGAAAEYILVDEDTIVKKPERLSCAQAAAIGVPYATALQTLNKVHVEISPSLAKSQDDFQIEKCCSVLILGATGAVGKAASSLCRIPGHRVVTASRGDSTDVNVLSDPQLARVTEILGGKGPDVIIDCVGSAKLMEAALKILGFGGRYAVLSAGKDGAWDAKVNMLSLYRSSQVIIGINSTEHGPKEVALSLKRIADWFDQGKLEPPDEQKLVKIKLEDGPDAYAEAWKTTGKKFVIVFD